MSVNVLTLDGLTNRKLKTIAENVIMGPQATILSQLNNINGNHNLSLGVTKTFRWSPGIYDQIKERIHHYNGFNMSNSGMRHLFRRIKENNRYWKRDLESKVIELEGSLQGLRAAGSIWQDNTDTVFDIFTLMKEQIQETYESINDDVQISYDILEQVDEDNNIAHKGYRIRFIIEYNNIDVHMWSSTKRYLGEVPTGRITLNIQMDLVKALNVLSSKKNMLFDIETLPSYFTGEGRAFIMKALYNNGVGIHHPFIGSRFARLNDRIDLNNFYYPAYCSETANQGWRNVCVGDMGSDIALKCINFNLNELNTKLKEWLSNFIVTRTHPLNPFSRWFHGWPKWLKDNKELDGIMGHIQNSRTCNNSLSIVEYAESAKRSEDELVKLLRMNDIQFRIDYCNSVECQLRDNCITYSIHGNPDYTYQQEQLMVELSVILFAPLELVHEAYSNESVDNLHSIIKAESTWDRTKQIKQIIKLESILYPDKIFADELSYLHKTSKDLWSGRALEDLIFSLEEAVYNNKDKKDVVKENNDKSMIKTLQNRMGMIPTISPNPNANQPQGDREQDHVESTFYSLNSEESADFEILSDPDDEMHDEEWEAYQRDMDENPEPDNLEEE